MHSTNNIKARTVLIGVLLITGFFGKAQNTKPVISPAHYKSGEEAEAADDRYSFQLDSLQIMQSVKKITGASIADMNLFCTYYADTLAKDRLSYFYEQSKMQFGHTDLEYYAKVKKEEYLGMYRKLQEIKKEFPSSIAEYSATHYRALPPSTCNVACTNIDFETGDLSGWNAYDATNNSTAIAMSYTGATGGPCGAVTKAAIDNTTNAYKSNTTYQVTITSGTGNDPIAGSLIPIVAPGGGHYSCRIGDSSVGGSRVGILQQTFQVSTSNENFTYQYAFLVDSAAHTGWERPYFSITIIDQTTGDTLPCGVYIVAIDTLRPGFDRTLYKIPSYGWTDPIFFKPWTSVFVPLQNYIGHCISVQATVSDCYPTRPGPHFCYAYFDASCGPLATISITSASSCGVDTLTAPAGGIYKWTGPCIVGSTTSQKILVNCAGTYTVDITSPDGCSDTLQKVVTFPPPMILKDTATNAGCNSKGSATVNVSGGIPPFTYSWSNGNTNAADTGLIAGTYTCIVTESGGCTGNITVTITQPNAMTINTIIDSANCNQSNGSATVNVSGGTAPFTYLWKVIGNTNAMVSSLSSGTYTITVTDKNGCAQTATATIPNINGETASLGSVKNISCYNGNDGNATVNVSGGKSPYTYLWYPSGQTNATATGLSVGTYTATITDANGCISIVTVTSTQPTAITINATTASANCNQNNGSATASVSGGTGPYTYTWNPGGNTTAIVTGLSASTYTITVTDKNGCTQTTTANVPNLYGATASIGAVINISCFNGSDGSATVNVSGGTTPYTYSWTPSGQTNSTATGLSVGIYTVTVKDANGCASTISETITQPAQLLANMANAKNVSCSGGNNGSAQVTISGGTGPYTYLWSPSGGTGAIGMGLTVGSYTVNVTDKNGCTITATTTITQPAKLVGSAASSQEVCLGNTTTISVSPSGGHPAYTYSWNNGITQNSPGPLTVNGSSTPYICTITDSCGDIIKDTVNVIERAAPAISACCNTTINLGRDTVIAASGKTIKTFQWEPSEGVICLNPPLCDSVKVTPTVTTTYTVTMTDSLGCQIERVITITVEEPCFNFTVPNVFTPNYAGANGVNNMFYIKTEGITDWSTNIYDRWGKEIFKTTNPNVYWTGLTEGGSKAPDGVYYYIITGTCQNITYKKDGFLQLIR